MILTPLACTSNHGNPVCKGLKTWFHRFWTNMWRDGQGLEGSPSTGTACEWPAGVSTHIYYAYAKPVKLGRCNYRKSCLRRIRNQGIKVKEFWILSDYDLMNPSQSTKNSSNVIKSYQRPRYEPTRYSTSLRFFIIFLRLLFKYWNKSHRKNPDKSILQNQ